MNDRFLSTPLRRNLERTIKEAREVAEEAAADAIRRLGVAHAKPPTYLDETGQELRRRLRAHGRALGDRKAPDDTQSTDRLIEAAAYEHWHRRLFARFLAERHLLRHPEHDVLVTLEDCKEFAAEEGLADEWAAAETYASKMLPAVFRPDDPVLELEFSPEHELKLRQLVLRIDAETFQADDALGWTYQFWRALEKDRVNKAGGKIGAAELPAVTQLFTEPYMVRFLLHNTLGAWWAGKVLAARPELAAEASDEAALRAAISPPGYEFDMLRFVRDGEEAPRWRPAAGTYPGWPEEAKAITVLDPCCGSGHFLTEALTILAALRAREEGLARGDAVAAVLRDNLFGLELDGRCVQIAAFAVALAAWKVGGLQALPPPHVAWVGATPPLAKAEFLALANGDEDLRRGLGALHELFVQAPLVGSLLDPSRGDLGDPHGARDFLPMMDKLVARAKRASGLNEDMQEGVITARGMADAASMLVRRYTLVVTNVPFLGRAKQDAALKTYIQARFEDARADLATAMISRALRFLNGGGSAAVVSPHNWFFLTGYKAFRGRVLSDYAINFFATLGEEAWEEFGDRGPLATLTALTNARSEHATHFAVDALPIRDRAEKKSKLQNGQTSLFEQSIHLGRDGARIVYEEGQQGESLDQYAIVHEGLHTGDYPQFGRKVWEFPLPRAGWEYQQGGTGDVTGTGGCEHVILWEGGSGRLIQQVSERLGGQSTSMWIKGHDAWGRTGITLGSMRDLKHSTYHGALFTHGIYAITPINPQDLPALRAFADSRGLATEVRKLDKRIVVSRNAIEKARFDVEHWREAAAKLYPDGVPEPYSDDATQWLFHGHPAGALPGTQLHVALARLAGYRWPAECDSSMHLSEEARAWITRAQELPAPDPDGLLTIPAAGGDRPLADRLRDYLEACFGETWSDALERQLVAEADERLEKKVIKDSSLDAWLRDRAFRQHCKLFHERPFLWHVWDGLKDGFSAFLHYHRLDRAAVQKLTYTVLGDWIARRKAEGDGRRLEFADILQSKLAAILEGETPCDVFVRWKALERQPIGWDPDLEDGVRINIRPWVEAGVLREVPKIKWGIDRGADVKSAPWYEKFNGARDNDHHTTLAEKRAARAAKSATAA